MSFDFVSYAMGAAAAGGGGGGAELPEVTTADNGKVLGVVGGAWDKTENAPYMVATYTATLSPDAESVLDIDSVSCDKTYSELFAQLAAGKPILAALQLYSDGYIFPMGSVVSAVRSADGTDAILITLLAGDTQLAIVHDPNDDVSINIKPIIYHYMEYDSTTQTLNIVTL